MDLCLFIPCLVDNFFPEIGLACAETLERAGFGVHYPDGQTCCGQPAYNAGHWDDARRVARNFLRVFAGREVIVAPSGSCVSMVRNHYGRLFEGYPAELALAERVGRRTFEFTEFLVKVAGVTDFGASFHGKVTVHESCHLKRELGVGLEPRILLEKVEGLELVEMEDPDRCCGFGGTFSLKFDAVSAAMARRKAENIEASGADAAVVLDPGCIMQIKGYLSRRGSRVKVLHPAQILAGDAKSST